MNLMILILAGVGILTTSVSCQTTRSIAIQQSTVRPYDMLKQYVIEGNINEINRHYNFELLP